MGNLDFTNEAGFSWYCILLIVSGVLMIALSPLHGQTKRGQILNLVFGMAFACYGLYLVYVFNGGTYIVFFKAFIVPVVLIINTIKSIAAQRKRLAAPANQTPQQ